MMTAPHSLDGSTAPATLDPEVACRVLVIDDEPGIRDLLESELSLNGYEVVTASDGEDAIQKMKQQKFRVAFCDLSMPKLGGLELLEIIRREEPEIEVIMMTGFATVETAVAAMKLGAYDFVQKPFNLNEVLALAEKSLEKNELKRVIQELRESKRRLELTQQQLIQAEKLAAIGRLAAGVAHELNNPLTGILGFAQLLLEEKLPPQQRKDIETIQTQSQRCRTIIQNLLHFSRYKEPTKETVEIIPLLDATLALIDYDINKPNITLIKKWPSERLFIEGDASQLQQVFINLMTNAKQAMGKKSDAQLTIDVQAKDATIFIRIEDNGPGMSPDIVGKIFDPFFTTKEPGQGTGLGLSICHGIIEQHQGKIRVESILGQGSTFTIELPKVDMNAAGAYGN